MKQSVVTINRPRGIHLSPASQIVQVVQKYKNCEVKLIKRGQQVNALSVLGILSLGLTYGSKIKVLVKGDNEANTKQCLNEIIAILSQETMVNENY